MSQTEKNIQVQRFRTIFELLYIFQNKIQPVSRTSDPYKDSINNYYDFTLEKSISKIEIKPVKEDYTNRITLMLHLKDLLDGFREIVPSTKLSRLAKVNDGELWKLYLEIEYKMIQELRTLYLLDTSTTSRICYYIISLNQYRFSLLPLTQNVDFFLQTDTFQVAFLNSFNTTQNSNPIELYTEDQLYRLNKYLFYYHTQLYNHSKVLDSKYWDIAYYSAYSPYTFQYNQTKFDFPTTIVSPLTIQSILDGQYKVELLEPFSDDLIKLFSLETTRRYYPISPNIEQITTALTTVYDPETDWIERVTTALTTVSDSKPVWNTLETYLGLKYIPSSNLNAFETCVYKLKEKQLIVQQCLQPFLKYLDQEMKMDIQRNLGITSYWRLQDAGNEAKNFFLQFYHDNFTKLDLLIKNLISSIQNSWALIPAAMIGVVLGVPSVALSGDVRIGLAVFLGTVIVGLVLFDKLLTHLYSLLVQLIYTAVTIGLPSAAIYYLTRTFYQITFKEKRNEIETYLSRSTIIQPKIRSRIIKSLNKIYNLLGQLLDYKTETVVPFNSSLQLLPLLLNF